MVVSGRRLRGLRDCRTLPTLGRAVYHGWAIHLILREVVSQLRERFSGEVRSGMRSAIKSECWAHSLVRSSPRWHSVRSGGRLLASLTHHSAAPFGDGLLCNRPTRAGGQQWRNPVRHTRPNALSPKSSSMPRHFLTAPGVRFGNLVK